MTLRICSSGVGMIHTSHFVQNIGNGSFCIFKHSSVITYLFIIFKLLGTIFMESVFMEVFCFLVPANNEIIVNKQF
jgi:hypothetical protein